jgi:hypothetical protein
MRGVGKAEHDEITVFAPERLAARASESRRQNSWIT